MTTPGRVRACIVAFRSLERAARACRSALEAGAETVLVDNGPGHDTADLIEETVPEVAVLRSKRNLGFAAASNRAAEGARTEYLLFLNPDAELDGGALDLMVEYLDGHPEAGIAGPALRFPDGRPQPSVRRDPTARAVLHQYTLFRYLLLFRGAYRRYRTVAPAGETPSDADVLMGSALLVRRRLFEDLGGFDARYFMYYEEADLCRRARRTGAGVVHVPSARAVHEGGASASLAAPGLAAVRMVSAQRYVRRFSPPGTRLAFRAAFLVAFPLGAMVDLVRDLLYAWAYAMWPPKHEKVGRKAREALASARLLTADLFKVAAG